MKRDMQLVRRIILAVADMPHGQMLQSLDGVPNEEFIRHVAWLEEAGLLLANVKEGYSSSDAQYAFIFRLTWSGCEFADAVRDNNLWNKATEKVIKPGVSFTFDLLKDWLKAEITQGFPTILGPK